MNKIKRILKYKIWILLTLIIIFASFFRIYNISVAPPALTWDEAAVGYNAWTIANYGRDETGKLLPLSFSSFLENKHPVHIYLTAIPVKIFGLSEFTTRITAALFGIFSIIIVFFTVRLIFKNDYIGLISAFVLAISPYAIHYSRFNHELNFALFFTFLGIYLFIKGIEKKSLLLSFAFLSFCVGFITYLSAKILIPIIIISLCLLYFKELLKIKKFFLIGLFFVFILGITVFFNPGLLGMARVKQVSLAPEQIENTFLYQNTKNQLLGKINLVIANYFTYFDLNYLFINGDKNPRLGSQVSGEFFKIDGLFLIIGFFGIIFLKKRRTLIILLLALLAPIPASFSNEIPHSGRAMFVVGSWHIIIAFGIYTFLKFFKFKKILFLVGALILFIYLFSFKDYIEDYYSEFNKRYAVDWQYGMKEVVEYVKEHPAYSQVYMTNVRHQPYIFFLFYTQKPLDEYLEEVEYNSLEEHKSFNLVAKFDKYYFEYWNPIESAPFMGNLYVLTSDQYDGLRYKNQFQIKKIIYYPNKSVAFYLVSVN